ACVPPCRRRKAGLERAGRKSSSPGGRFGSWFSAGCEGGAKRACSGFVLMLLASSDADNLHVRTSLRSWHLRAGFMGRIAKSFRKGRIDGISRDLRLHAIHRLARGHKERLTFRAAEGEVGDEVLRNRDRL